MNTLKIKKAVLIVWMTLALSFGTGIAGVQLGFNSISATYACGSGHGGGC